MQTHHIKEAAMKIGILGTGIVARTHAARLAQRGHAVMLGTRDPKDTLTRSESDWMGNPPFPVWQTTNPQIQLGTYEEAASFGEMVINATLGSGSLEALGMADPDNLAGKILIDISNPLDYSEATPTLYVCGTDSLGEQIQRFLPRTRVVKTLNTATVPIQVNPAMLAGGDHHAFISGNDAEAKAEVTRFLQETYGWRRIVDIGDITSARAAEMMLPMWIQVFGIVRSPFFNFKIVGLPEE
jgi:predicted dinucleotide-binding enzyme